MNRKIIIGLFFLLECLFILPVNAAISVVAAENFYGDVAEQLGGPYVQVISILKNPNQDPHLFSASPQTAILLTKADIIIENGAGYDTWMDVLKTKQSHAITLNVSQLMHLKAKANPHIWYNPETMPLLAQALTTQFIQKDPEHRAFYEEKLAHFFELAADYKKRIEEMRDQVAGISVTATEPVVNDLLDALKLHILNQAFQWAMMNETDLTPQEVMQFDDCLSEKKAKCLIYNSQVISPVAEHLKALALQQHIPIVGVTETLPANEHYYAWMNRTLDDIQRVLQ